MGISFKDGCTFLVQLAVLLSNNIAFARSPYCIGVQVRFLDGDEVVWRFNPDPLVDRITNIKNSVEDDAKICRNNVLEFVIRKLR